jgi:hypothetical protein
MDRRWPGPYRSGIPVLWFCAIGVGHSGFRKSRGERPAERIATALVLLASGVGNNPESVASVRGTNGGRWYAVPLRVVPARGQVSENSAEPSAKQSCDILHDDKSGSKIANQSGDLAPKSRTLALDPNPRAGVTDVLAGEAAADDIDGNSSLGQSGSVEGSHVVKAGDLRPVLGEHRPRKGFDLAEGDRLEAAGALQPKAEASNPAEQVEDAELAHAALASSRQTPSIRRTRRPS